MQKNNQIILFFFKKNCRNLNETFLKNADTCLKYAHEKLDTYQLCLDEFSVGHRNRQIVNSPTFSNRFHQ